METLLYNLLVMVVLCVVHPTPPRQAVDIFPVTVQSHGFRVPLDAVQCQKLKPPTRRRDRELVPVVVERIESPSNFYIRFYEDQEARTLENMMFEMRLFFDFAVIQMA